MSMEAGDPALLGALGARCGVVAVVGAGGKKTTMYRLAALHPGRVGLTTTVHIPPYPDGVAERVITGTPEDVLAAAVAECEARVIACAGPADKTNRLAGLPPESIERLARATGRTLWLVKADGARARWIKAPGDHEPRVPAAATTVIAVVSARAIGEPLTDRIAHRPERLAAVMGARLGEAITPEHVARLLASPDGALRGAGDAEVVPLINMLDDEDTTVRARAAARAALALTDRFDRVVLAAMARGALIEVVEREG